MEANPEVRTVSWCGACDLPRSSRSDPRGRSVVGAGSFCRRPYDQRVCLCQEALAHLYPIRDSFVALSFVTMGLLVDPRALISNLPLLGVMVVLILVGKFVIWTTVVRLFGYSIWTAVVVAVGLTQIGEFSFILVQVARNSGLVGPEVDNATLAASMVTILVINTGD